MKSLEAQAGRYADAQAGFFRPAASDSLATSKRLGLVVLDGNKRIGPPPILSFTVSGASVALAEWDRPLPTAGLLLLHTTFVPWTEHSRYTRGLDFKKAFSHLFAEKASAKRFPWWSSGQEVKTVPVLPDERIVKSFACKHVTQAQV